MDTIIWMVSSIAPVYFAAKLAAMMKKMIMGGWQNRLKPEWNLNPEDAASISFQAPMVTDTIVPLLEAGRVKFVSGVRKITAVGDVELQDGHVMRPDAMIFCTGYNIDTTLSTEVQRVGDLQLPRLYHNIYHPEHPTSLAYLTFWYTIGGIYELGDLAAMGIAQVFAGRFKLPDHDFMQRRIEASHDFVNQLASRSPQPITFQGAARCVDRGPWITFLHEAAGTEVPSKLGYGFSGWKFWLSDRKFCHLLMNGVNSIHVARLFDGRPGSRPRWEGARKAIIEANEDVRRIEEERKAQYPKDKQA
jgi:dimethylaniline monooxygenase (N-oxide forming)